MSAPLAYPIDSAVVRALFSDGGITLNPAQLLAALHRRGFGGELVDWLPLLRGAGLREPRAGVFGPPCELPTADPDSPFNPENTNEGSKRAAIAEPAPAAPEPPRFSYFRGGIRTAAPYAAITPRQLWDVITGPTFAAVTARLRAAPAGSEQRAELKKCLDYVTPAGIFTRRANAGLAEPSGYLVLDFDHVGNLAAARAALLQDAHVGPALVLLFTSPGGEGLKAIIAAAPDAPHLDNFRALSAYLSHHYGAVGLTPDPSGKDVARACFVCHDAAAWLAPELAA